MFYDFLARAFGVLLEQALGSYAFARKSLVRFADSTNRPLSAVMAGTLIINGLTGDAVSSEAFGWRFAACFDMVDDAC